jgi:hypothetical protein
LWNRLNVGDYLLIRSKSLKFLSSFDLIVLKNVHRFLDSTRTCNSIGKVVLGGVFVEASPWWSGKVKSLGAPSLPTTTQLRNSSFYSPHHTDIDPNLHDSIWKENTAGSLGFFLLNKNNLRYFFSPKRLFLHHTMDRYSTNEIDFPWLSQIENGILPPCKIAMFSPTWLFLRARST